MAVDRFRYSAEAPQTPHVEPDVQQAAVDENASQEPPPLATDSKRAVVCSPMHKVRPGRIVEHGNACQQHGDEHGNVDAENPLSYNHRAGFLPEPRRRFDSLSRNILPALRSFMLLAPLTFPAEAKGWKLTAALFAICHEGLKAVRGAVWKAPSHRESTLPI